MAAPFHKMHGLGNDFVVIDGRGTPVEMTTARARAIADRPRHDPMARAKAQRTIRETRDPHARPTPNAKKDKACPVACPICEAG
ncbi:MAG: hypothetical protein ACK44T_08695, partial [Sphingomonadales bacterium]